MADPALLPLATLARSDSPAALLNQVATQVARIEETRQRQAVCACAYVLAGLRFETNLLRRLFREDIMRESVTYQDILQQGELKLVMRQLTRRVGAIAPDLAAQIQDLSIPQLEELGEALLDFSTLTDLTTWLETHK